MSAAEPIASGRLETKIATSSPTLTPSPAAMPMPRTVCSGMPSRDAPSATAAPAPPAAPPPGGAPAPPPPALTARGPVEREVGERADGEAAGHGATVAEPRALFGQV